MALKMVDTYVIKLAVVKSNSDLKRLLASINYIIRFTSRNAPT
jgi:hypothetical protein